MVKRNADQIMGQAAEEITIGGESFKVKPMVIKNSRKFRNQVLEIIGKAGSLEQAGDLSNLVNMIQSFFDEELVALVKLAVPEFASKDKKWIEENVTEAELQEALGVIFSINFPWIRKAANLSQLGAMVQKK